MTKSAKTILILVFINITYIIHVGIITSYRVKADEDGNLSGVLAILDYGNLFDGDTYASGHIFEVQMSTILLITDNGFVNIEWISPVASISVMITILFSLIMLIQPSHNEIPHWWVLFTGFMLLGMPSIISRVIESTHKGNTIALSILLLTVCLRFATDLRNKKIYLPIIGILSFSLSLSNLVFAAILFFPLCSYILFQIFDRDGFNLRGLSAILIIPSTLFISFSYSALLWSDRIWLHLQSLITGSYQAFFHEDPDLGSEGGNGLIHEINQWPTIELHSLEFTSWYLFSLAEMIIIPISLAGGVYCLTSILLYKNRNPVQLLYTFISLYYFVIVIGAIMSGSIDLVKRLVVIPAILSLAIFSQLLREFNNRDSFKFFYRILVVLLLLSGLFSIPLGYERVTAAGGEKPIDHYLSENQKASVNWIAENNSDRLTTQVRSIQYGVQILGRSDIHTHNKVQNSHNNLVYNSGGESRIYSRL